MSPEKPKFIRKIYLTDKKFQLRYVKIIILFVLAVLTVSDGLAFLILMNELENSGVDRTLLTIPFREGIKFIFLFQFALTIPVVVIYGIVLTHRIIGPLGRMKRWIADLGEGNFGTQFKLRQKDELVDLVDGLNEMSTNLARLRDLGKLMPRTEESEDT